MTWKQYGESLEENLEELSGRLRRRAYRAKPVRRSFILKADDKQRIAALEVSPLLANIFLHYVFDEWAHDWRRQSGRGEVLTVFVGNKPADVVVNSPTPPSLGCWNIPTPVSKFLPGRVNGAWRYFVRAKHCQR